MVAHAFDVVFHAISPRLPHTRFDFSLREFGFDSDGFDIEFKFIRVAISKGGHGRSRDSLSLLSGCDIFCRGLTKIIYCAAGQNKLLRLYLLPELILWLLRNARKAFAAPTKKGRGNSDAAGYKGKS